MLLRHLQLANPDERSTFTRIFGTARCCSELRNHEIMVGGIWHDLYNPRIWLHLQRPGSYHFGAQSLLDPQRLQASGAATHVKNRDCQIRVPTPTADVTIDVRLHDP